MKLLPASHPNHPDNKPFAPELLPDDPEFTKLLTWYVQDRRNIRKEFGKILLDIGEKTCTIKKL